jgi:L-aminopeptidase/D-esterase-like protein
MATGTRELGVLSPHHLVSRINAVLLTGGSAFGLAAADGVVAWLAERGEGFHTGVAPVPLVPAAVIFDLDPGVARPGPDEGRRGSETASTAPVPEGRVGAGAGATVGKLLGSATASPGGIGSTSRVFGGGTIGALAVVNALGDVVSEDGEVLAGVRGPSGTFQRSDSIILEGRPLPSGMPGTNTTLAVVATDLPLSRVDLGKLAKMASTAFPRAISPVNTPFDGDLVFSLSTADSEQPLATEDLLALGIVARELTEEAIRRAVRVGGEAGDNPFGKEP